MQMENKNSPLAEKGVISQDTAGAQNPNLQKIIVRGDLLPKMDVTSQTKAILGVCSATEKSLDLKVNNKYINNIPGFSNPASIYKGNCCSVNIN